VASAGIAVEYCESNEAAACVAAPVYDGSGLMVAAMSIAVRAERMSFVEFRDAFLPALRKASATLAGRLYPE
jgi:IclR family pca regulon transcriptional regulator